MSEIMVLNVDEAYKVDVTSVTDVLTTGLYVKEAPQIIRGFDSAEHTISIVTDAALVRALHIDYVLGGHAIWKVYQQPEGQPEVFYGYLVVTLTDGTIASIDSENMLGDAVTAEELFTQALFSYFASADPADYEGDEVTDSITVAKGKIRFEEEA